MCEISAERFVEILLHLVDDKLSQEQMQVVQQEKNELCTSNNAFLLILYYLQDKLELPEQITQDTHYKKYKDIFKISLIKLIPTELFNLISNCDVDSVIHELGALYMNLQNGFDEIAVIFNRIRIYENSVNIESLLKEIESMEGFESNLLLQCKYASLFARYTSLTSENGQFQTLWSIFQSLTETPEILFSKFENENNYKDYYVLNTLNSVLYSIWIGSNTDAEIRLQQIINYDYFLRFFEYSKLSNSNIPEYESNLTLILNILNVVFTVMENEDFAQNLANFFFNPIIELIQYNLANNYILFEDNIGISAKILENIFMKIQNFDNFEQFITTLIICCYPYNFDRELAENEGFFEKYFDVHYQDISGESDPLFSPAKIIIKYLLCEDSEIVTTTWNILMSNPLSPATVTIVTMLVHSCIPEAFVMAEPNNLSENLSNDIKLYIENYLNSEKPDNYSDEMYYLYTCFLCTILPYFGDNNFPEISGEDGSVIQISAISLFFRHVRVSLISRDKTYLTEEIAQQVLEKVNECYFRESNKTLLVLINTDQSVGKDIILEVFRNEIEDMKSVIENGTSDDEDEVTIKADKIVMDATQIIELVASYRDFDEEFINIYLSILHVMETKQITVDSFFSLPFYYAKFNPMVFIISMIVIFSKDLFYPYIYDSMMKFNVEFSENPKIINLNQTTLFIRKIINLVYDGEEICIDNIDLESTCLFFALAIFIFDIDEELIENICNFAYVACSSDGIEFLSGLELISSLVIKLNHIPSQEIIDKWLEFSTNYCIKPSYPRALLGTALRKISTLTDYQNENVVSVSNILLQGGQLPEIETKEQEYFYQGLHNLYPDIKTIPLFNSDEFVSVLDDDE